ncbi:MAG: methyl-accepting chemotaxis protein [Treponema sp.]|jgi:methyl-accepting chemotaxis protein|nr:methyl-accepting chemotaxis protein [Treponema sp.]
MKLKLKLSLTVILMITAVIAIAAVVTLTRSSGLITKEAENYIEQIVETYTEAQQRRFETYIRPAMTLAQLFGEYHTIPVGDRREQFDNMLKSLTTLNENYAGVWTGWLPNALDGMDDRHGRYNTTFTRRNGPVEVMDEGYEGWENILADIIRSPDKCILSGPSWRTIKGYDSEVPVVTVVYKITDSRTNQAVGYVGINFISSIQDFVAIIAKEIYDGKGVAGFYNELGITVAHFDKTRVQGLIQENPTEQARLGDRMNEVVNLIRNGGDPLSMTRYSKTLGTDMHIIYQPIPIMDAGTTWTMMVAVPMNEVTRGVRDMTIFTIIFALAAIIVSAVIAFFFAVRIVKPIISISNTLKDISEGEGDLTRVIAEEGKDETTDMAHYFNLTLEKIRNLVITIKRQANMLFEIGNQLSSNMTETAAAVNQITANIQNIKGRVMNQSASVTQTNATVEQITGNIDKLNGHIERQTSSVSQSSSAIEQMLANIQSVTTTLMKNATNVKELMDASEVGKTGLQGVATDIQEIARESEGLLEINSVMENIASQTNLLSMNAAIEAAHAGEAGKGFAVVADGMRKLEESSSEQSKTISTVLKKIKFSIDKISQSTDNVLNKFGAIDGGVKTVADQEENIRNAMEEQGQGSKQILNAIGQVNEITHQVKGSSEEMLEGSKEVLKEGGNLEKVTEEITGGMNEMASGADQINIAVNQVNDLSTKNRENIDMLVKEVARFKVE